MLTARHAAIRLLKLMMVASLVLPAVLFAFAATVSYRNFERVADERMQVIAGLDLAARERLELVQRLDAECARLRQLLSES